VQIFRHSAAKLRPDAGDSIEDVAGSSTTQAWRRDDLLAPPGGAGGSELGEGWQRRLAYHARRRILRRCSWSAAARCEKPTTVR
jgi:hypothetical protein